MHEAPENWPTVRPTRLPVGDGDHSDELASLMVSINAMAAELERSRGLERQFLHATRLSFTHPISGEEIDVTSPLPSDLASALEAARRRH